MLNHIFIKKTCIFFYIITQILQTIIHEPTYLKILSKLMVNHVFIKKTWLNCSNVSCFPCGVEFPSVSTSVSQLSRRDPNNNNPNTPSAKGISKEIVWFKCSTILELSWYLSFTIFLNRETLFGTFLVSNILSIFFDNIFAFASTSKLLYRLMSMIQHHMYALVFRCMTSQVDASFFIYLSRPHCTCNHKSLHNKMSRIFDFHIV